jgi:hypothetical protein
MMRVAGLGKSRGLSLQRADLHRMSALPVAVNRLHGEGRKANGNVFRTSLGRSGVLNPFAPMRDDCLPGVYVDVPILVSHSHHALENQSEFVEFRSLSRFFPALRAAHVGDAYASSLGVDSSDVFIDQLGFGSGGGNASRLRYQNWHEGSFENDYCSKRRHKFGRRVSLITKVAHGTEELAPGDRGFQDQLRPAEFARVFLLWEAKASSAGIETGAIKERSSGIVPF